MLYNEGRSMLKRYVRKLHVAVPYLRCYVIPVSMCNPSCYLLPFCLFVRMSVLRHFILIFMYAIVYAWCIEVCWLAALHFSSLAFLCVIEKMILYHSSFQFYSTLIYSIPSLYLFRYIYSVVERRLPLALRGGDRSSSQGLGAGQGKGQVQGQGGSKQTNSPWSKWVHTSNDLLQCFLFLSLPFSSSLLFLSLLVFVSTLVFVFITYTVSIFAVLLLLVISPLSPTPFYYFIIKCSLLTVKFLYLIFSTVLYVCTFHYC